LFGILRSLEADGRTGLIRVCAGSEVVGHVMIAAGRLCFAASVEGHTPIGRMLTEGDPTLVAELDEAVHEARSSGSRFCEVVLKKGSLALERIRYSLLLQTVRALAAIVDRLAEAGASFDLTPAADDYDRRLTFTAMEVLVATLAASDTDPPDNAAELFAEFAEYAEGAFLFVRGAGPGTLPFPVAVRGLEEGKLQDVLVLARAAHEMSLPLGLARAGIQPRVVTFQGPGGSWVCGTGQTRIALIRTSPRCEAGQVVGYALRLWRRVP
jgi:hypothetical protein